jgi:TonB family protein
MKQVIVGYGCVALSVVVHAVALRRNGGESWPRPVPTFVPVVMAFAPPVSPSLPQPAPPPEPEPEPAPKPQPRRPPKPAPIETQPLPAREQVGASEPPLTGATLVASAEASWAAPAGNGEARSGALGVGAASTALAHSPSPRSAVVTAPAAAPLPLSRLSRKPVPPPLQQTLARYYPPLARSQGRSGEAKVRALIQPNGHVSQVELAFESEPGFGAACQKALQQSRWTGPLGPSGEPTATFITYRCKFRIED